MESTCRCGRPLEFKDTGICETCWHALFEEPNDDLTVPFIPNIIRLETELPF